MSDWWTAVGATVAAALILGLILWLLRPWAGRLEKRRMIVTGDHGIAHRVYTSPSDMQGLNPAQMLDLEPAWLADSDFFFPQGIPGNGPASEADWPAWVAENRGINAGWKHILIHVQSTQDRAVLLLSPRITVTRSDATQGVILGPERAPGGNGLMCRQFNVDLGDAAPTVRYLPGWGPSRGKLHNFDSRRARRRRFSSSLTRHAGDTSGRSTWNVSSMVSWFAYDWMIRETHSSP